VLPPVEKRLLERLFCDDGVFPCQTMSRPSPAPINRGTGELSLLISKPLPKDLLQKWTVICYIETVKSRIAGTGLAALERTTSNETNTLCDLR
jgi:hypothetical protein